MKKAINLGLMVLTILSISGCNEAVYSVGQPRTLTHSLLENHRANEWEGMKDDFADVNQEIQLYSADGALLLTITENEDIFIFIRSLELDKWDYSLKEIPPEALRLCTRVGRLEQKGELVVQAVETVYYDQNGFYQISEAAGGGAQNKMSDGAARYLIDLAGLELTGTHRFADHEFYSFGGDDGVESKADVAAASGYAPPFADLTYEGMLAASAENLIEVCKDGAVVQRIADNQEVFEFLLSLNTSRWTTVEQIPDRAAEIASVIRYQLGRREYAGQMMEQSRLILYHDGIEYYMDSLISDNGSGHGDRFNECYPRRFLIPAEIGEALSA